MKTIEEYAIDLIASGGESTAEDDLNESGEIEDVDHQAACDLAVDIAHFLRANPVPFMEWYRSRRSAGDL